MFIHTYLDESAAGVAEVNNISMTSDRVQISCRKITTGTGTVTITVKAGTADEYSAITDGTITLSAPIAVLVSGKITAVKATSSSSSDVFELEVNS
jgi:hypothetical protein